MSKTTNIISTISIDEIIAIIEKQLADSKWFATPPKYGQLIFRGEPGLYKTALLPGLFRLKGDKQFSESYLYEEFQRAYPQYFLKRWRQLVCFFLISKLTRCYSFSENDLCNIDVEEINLTIVEEVWRYINSRIDFSHQRKFWKSKDLFIHLCQDVSITYNIPLSNVLSTMPSFSLNYDNNSFKVNLDFALILDQTLPPQPWKPGVHLEMMEKFNCSKKIIMNAMNFLIEEGIRHSQKDGIVYNQDGSIKCFDTERVDPLTMKLL